MAKKVSDSLGFAGGVALAMHLFLLLWIGTFFLPSAQPPDKLPDLTFTLVQGAGKAEEFGMPELEEEPLREMEQIAEEQLLQELSRAKPKKKPPKRQARHTRKKPRKTTRTTSQEKGKGIKGEGLSVVRRYEQLLSAFIGKHRHYPETAIDKGLEGTVIIRLRIRRNGKILRFSIYQGSGYTELDRAAYNIQRRINRVPAVPRNYPPGDPLEFLIPVGYILR